MPKCGVILMVAVCAVLLAHAEGEVTTGDSNFLHPLKVSRQSSAVVSRVAPLFIGHKSAIRMSLGVAHCYICFR